MFGAIAKAATTISADEGFEGGQSISGSAELQDVLVQMCYCWKLCFPYLSFSAREGLAIILWNIFR